MQRSNDVPEGDAPESDVPADEPRACLDEQEVVDFAGGLLPAARIASVEEHLGGCERCTALVATAAPHLGRDASARAGLASPTQITRSVETQPLGMTPMPRTGPGRDRPRWAPGTPLDTTYQVVRFLGRGGMGDVYEVKHARLAGRYAAKLLSTDLVDNAQAFSRFQREALIASGLSHPNIVNVIDFCHLPDGLPCLVMEYLDGVDLADVMSRGPLSLPRTLRLVRQVVSALSTLHGHKIIHRDLKPQNIFVLPEHDGEPERVKLVDFGLAKRSNPSMIVTHDRTLLGTPQYMAPEQAIGNADGVGPEADQFSLAAIVYEMLAARHPFSGEVLSTVLYRIVHEAPAPLANLAPHVPPHVGAAIERALAKDRQARFPSVKAFLQALEGEALPMTPAPVETKQRRSWFIRREVLASAGVLVAAAGIVGIFRVIKDPGHAAEPPFWKAGATAGQPQQAAPPPGGPTMPQSPSSSFTIDRGEARPAGPAPAPAPAAPATPAREKAAATGERAIKAPVRGETRRRRSEGGVTRAEPASAARKTSAATTVPADPASPSPSAASAPIEPPAPAVKPPPILIEKL